MISEHEEVCGWIYKSKRGEIADRDIHDIKGVLKAGFPSIANRLNDKFTPCHSCFADFLPYGHFSRIFAINKYNYPPMATSNNCCFGSPVIQFIQVTNNSSGCDLSTNSCVLLDFALLKGMKRRENYVTSLLESKF